MRDHKMTQDQHFRFIDKDDDRYDDTIDDIGKCYSPKQLLIKVMEKAIERFPYIVETVYRMESQVDEEFVGWATATLEFNTLSYFLGMKDDILQPLLSAIIGDERAYKAGATFTVDFSRHHPTTLNVGVSKGNESIFDLDIELIKFLDNLHMESMSHYDEIVKLGQKRIQEKIDELKSKVDCQKCGGKLEVAHDPDGQDDLYHLIKCSKCGWCTTVSGPYPDKITSLKGEVRK